MFDWVLRESDSSWWATTCGYANTSVCAASKNLGQGDDDRSNTGGDTNDNVNSLWRDPETGRYVVNRLASHQHGQMIQQQLENSPQTSRTSRISGNGERSSPRRVDMAAVINRTFESFDDMCESLHENKPTQNQPQELPPLSRALPPSKRDSLISMHTDDSTAVSENSDRDEADLVAKDDATTLRLRRRRIYCLWFLALVGMVGVLGVGIGIGLSSASENNKYSSSASKAESSNVDSQVAQPSDDGFPDSAGSPSQEVGSGTSGTEGDAENGLSITAPPNLDVNLDEAANDPGSDGYDYTANSDYLVGVYYYPWYGDNFHSGGGYLRKQLNPPQQPALGEYNDSLPEVIKQHLHWSRKANIGLWVTSWWGPDRLEDSNTKDVILPHEDIGNLKIALHYETTGRITSSNMTTPKNDIVYMCEHYFSHPNYYKIDGRPVLVIYVTRTLQSEGLLEGALLTMRSEASKCGQNLYLIGDQVFADAPNPDVPFVPFWYFDAVTNYDVYGSSGAPNGYAGAELVDNYYIEQEKWRQQALVEDCRFVPPVSPGYNDRGVRLESDHPPMSRHLTAAAEEGSLFWYQLKKALPLVDPKVNNLILVNSFNEWHEDTQIEPALGDPASEPVLLTGGLTYVGYGELYLDILAAATTRGQNNTVFDYLFG